MTELQVALAQRDILARYIFEQDDGTLDSEYCRVEMASMRCPYRNLPYGGTRKVQICGPCIVNLLCKNADFH